MLPVAATSAIAVASASMARAITALANIVSRKLARSSMQRRQCSALADARAANARIDNGLPLSSVSATGGCAYGGQWKSFTGTPATNEEPRLRQLSLW